jgi:hypothetical protein
MLSRLEKAPRPMILHVVGICTSQSSRLDKEGSTYATNSAKFSKSGDWLSELIATQCCLHRSKLNPIISHVSDMRRLSRSRGLGKLTNTMITPHITDGELQALYQSSTKQTHFCSSLHLRRPVTIPANAWRSSVSLCRRSQ